MSGLCFVFGCLFDSAGFNSMGQRGLWSKCMVRVLTISYPMVEKTEFEILVFSIFTLSGRTLSGLQSSREGRE
jgi:hypothetical protein